MTVKECPICYKIVSGRGETQTMLFFELHVRNKHMADDEDDGEES